MRTHKFLPPNVAALTTHAHFETDGDPGLWTSRKFNITLQNIAEAFVHGRLPGFSSKVAEILSITTRVFPSLAQIVLDFPSNDSRKITHVEWDAIKSINN